MGTKIAVMNIVVEDSSSVESVSKIDEINGSGVRTYYLGTLQKPE